tara:strand:+ start:2028 stop:2972 length:945 start_codon:yes stop_codon:yes gene_type:complete
MKISIIVPIFNEEKCIPELIKEFQLFHQQNNNLIIEFIFIDDGSKDNSYKTIKTCVDKLSWDIVIIQLTRNYGQTAALSAGIKNAKGDILITIDGDLQNDIFDVPMLIKQLNKGYDVVCGWRKERSDNYLTRILPSKIANWMISKISGVHLHDYGCTLKVYKRKILKDIKLYGEMHRFIPIYISWQGGKILEVPVNHKRRFLGKSKYGILRTFSVIADLIFLKFMEKQFSKPIHLFGGFAIINFSLSILSFILMIYFKYFMNKSFIQTPLPELIILFLMVGTLSIFMGFIAEIIMRTYFESQNISPYNIRKINK